MKKIAIFGTGKYGEKIYNFLKNVVGIQHISFFVKTDVRENEKFNNHSIVSLKDIGEELVQDIIIFIAIRDRKTVIDIKRQLFQMDFKTEQIIDVNSFLLDNVIINMENEELLSGKHICLCCGHQISHFWADGEKNSDLFIHHNIIGGGYRENNVCPQCGAIDRERWQMYVLKQFTEILTKRCNVLHIAPEDAIYRLIKNNIECDYYLGDVELGRSQHKCDLTDIQFKDNFFDYIIANHVLEHISKIELAFSEIKRVLKTDGQFITSFPICIDERTIEEDIILNEDERLRLFGQKDHVRLFGYDYENYFEKNGFNVKIMSPKDILHPDMIRKYGLIKDDVLLICTKQKR